MQGKKARHYNDHPSFDMKTRSTVVLAILVALAGCDAIFARRMDISTQGGVSFSIDTPSASLVAKSISDYAAENGMTCSSSDQLPIECDLQPIRIWAVPTEAGAVVCYAAWGIPPESGKFSARMDALQRRLERQFKVVPDSSRTQPCPPTPSSERYRAEQSAGKTRS
jgi:hypothetical protein